MNSQNSSLPKELPPILNAATFTATPMSEPAQVVHGVIHRGSKAVYGGPSKAFKTWSLLDACLAVSTGGDWLGFPTTKGNALYINFELQPFAVHKRLLAIADSRGCEVPKNLHIWNLRGYSQPLPRLLSELKRQISGEGFSLIVPDPIYKTLAGRNENDAGDIGELCGELESVALETNAAVAFGAHFAKGNASSKDSIDRVSGSGVWARDPDSIITATRHETEDAFTVEMTLRNLPPPAPFVIRWQYPRMTRDDSLDPARLRRPINGRTKEYTTANILTHLTAPMTATEWRKVCSEDGGISETTFYRRMRDAVRDGHIRKQGKLWEVAA